MPGLEPGIQLNRGRVFGWPGQPAMTAGGCVVRATSFHAEAIADAEADEEKENGAENGLRGGKNFQWI
jgi:hypothetical protein